jgi:hypothetical protein
MCNHRPKNETRTPVRDAASTVVSAIILVPCLLIEAIFNPFN